MFSWQFLKGMSAPIWLKPLDLKLQIRFLFSRDSTLAWPWARPHFYILSGDRVSTYSVVYSPHPLLRQSFQMCRVRWKSYSSFCVWTSPSSSYFHWISLWRVKRHRLSQMSMFGSIFALLWGQHRRHPVLSLRHLSCQLNCPQALRSQAHAVMSLVWTTTICHQLSLYDSWHQCLQRHRSACRSTLVAEKRALTLTKTGSSSPPISFATVLSWPS